MFLTATNGGATIAITVKTSPPNSQKISLTCHPLTDYCYSCVITLRTPPREKARPCSSASKPVPASPSPARSSIRSAPAAPRERFALGDRLPSVRELARQLAVNQNTILRAYERLTAEGILELRHGEGTFVADFATGRRLKKERTALEEDAERLARRAADLRMTAEELHALIDEVVARISPAAAVKTRA